MNMFDIMQAKKDVASMAAALKLKPQEMRSYTYADYCEWDDDERWELIDGVAYAMAAPLVQHQDVSRNIFIQIANFLKGKKCKVYYSPIDVRLNADTKDNTIVQPDIIVVCDKSKIDLKSIIGAPEMVVEVLSPSNASYDLTKKYKLYLQVGVREYWVVDPVFKTVVTHILADGKYIGTAYDETKIVPVSVLEGCIVDLSEVFEE